MVLNSVFRLVDVDGVALVFLVIMVFWVLRSLPYRSFVQVVLVLILRVGVFAFVVGSRQAIVGEALIVNSAVDFRLGKLLIRLEGIVKRDLLSLGLPVFAKVSCDGDRVFSDLDILVTNALNFEAFSEFEHGK